jgi:hypothetical protein
VRRAGILFALATACGAGALGAPSHGRAGGDAIATPLASGPDIEAGPVGSGSTGSGSTGSGSTGSGSTGSGGEGSDATDDCSTHPTTKVAQMSCAEIAYDKQNFDEARALAVEVLRVDPTNAPMTRLLVTIACIEGDKEEATRRWAQVAERDRERIRQRCSRFGITFP